MPKLAVIPALRCSTVVMTGGAVDLLAVSALEGYMLIG